MFKLSICHWKYMRQDMSLHLMRSKMFPQLNDGSSSSQTSSFQHHTLFWYNISPGGRLSRSSAVLKWRWRHLCSFQMNGFQFLRPLIWWTHSEQSIFSSLQSWKHPLTWFNIYRENCTDNQKLNNIPMEWAALHTTTVATRGKGQPLFTHK